MKSITNDILKSKIKQYKSEENIFITDNCNNCVLYDSLQRKTNESLF